MLWDTDIKGPILTLGMFLRDDTYPKQSEEVIGVTGITDELLKEFGEIPGPNLLWLNELCRNHGVSFLCGHNIRDYDYPLLLAELARNGVEAPVLTSLPLLDTMTDIEFVKEPDSRKLKYMASDHAFLNPFSHRAVFDALTSLRILSEYALDDVIAYSREPQIIVRAQVRYEDRELAKGKKYRWETIGDKRFEKCWVKRIRQNKLDEERAGCPFPVLVLE